MSYNEMRPFIQRLKSRKFLLALANFVFIAINEVYGAPVDRDSYFAITGGIIAFICGESYVDSKAQEKIIINEELIEVLGPESVDS